MKKSFLRFSLLFFSAAASLFILISCSSAPKRTMQINTIYKNVVSTLESSNSALNNGNYSQTESLLNSAYKAAMSIDNYDLLTTICLSYVSLYLSYQTPDLNSAQEYINQAYLCADYSTNQERNKALCDLSNVRLQLAQGKTDYPTYISQLEQAQSSIKNDPYNEGIFYSVKGDVYIQQEDYKNAETAYSQAVNIFTKECYLGEIGINWYKIAQTRSLGKNKEGALDAIRNALKYDRDSENSLALGTDYYAMGLIYKKNNPSEEEKINANYCFEHSAQIFNSIDMEANAEKSLKEKF